MSEREKNKFDGWDVWKICVRLFIATLAFSFCIKLFSLILF